MINSPTITFPCSAFRADRHHGFFSGSVNNDALKKCTYYRDRDDECAFASTNGDRCSCKQRVEDWLRDRISAKVESGKINITVDLWRKEGPLRSLSDILEHGNESGITDDLLINNLDYKREPLTISIPWE